MKKMTLLGYRKDFRSKCCMQAQWSKTEVIDKKNVKIDTYCEVCDTHRTKTKSRTPSGQSVKGENNYYNSYYYNK